MSSTTERNRAPSPQLATPGPAPRPRLLGIVPYFWVAPALAVFALFTLLPVAVALGLSFTSWDGSGDPVFNGLHNYAQAFGDGEYWTAILHNIQYAVGTVVGKLVLSLGLALAMNQVLPARAIFRTALFLPVVLSFVVVGLLWSWIYNYDAGLLNSMLGHLGLESLQRDWLGDQKVALWALVIVDIWKWFGFHMIIFLAGLQSIPQELYEAGRIDGATSWRLLRHITLPLILPISLINLVLAASGAFNVFDVVYVMTEGGPVNATNVAMMEIYKQAFQFYHFGYSSALSVVQLVLVSVVSLTLLLVIGRRGQLLGQEHG
jgi:raffinose/stachyose/melibiose transport system permease protein